MTRPPAQALARWRAPLAAGGLLACLGLLALAAWRLAQMPVQRVAFSGDLRRVSRAVLEERVDAALSGGFFSADLERIRRPLEALPWVYRVRVKRRWPGELEVVVTEQLPIARWSGDSYLNHAGEIFTPREYWPMPSLVLLEGPPEQRLPLLRSYRHLRERLAALGLEVAALRMDARGGLVATLGGGGELVFGRGRFQPKLARFLGVYSAELAAGMERVRAVDLRYRHGLAVAWRGG